MATKSKGINLLSTVCGFTLVLLWIILLFRTFGGSDIISWGGLVWIIFLIITSLLAYFLGWGTIRMIYWIYCGFKEDKEKVMKGGE